MAKNILINGITYSNLPFMSAPLAAGNGNAVFWDIDDTTLSNGGQLRNGVIVHKADGSVVTGSMTEKASATYTPSSTEQSIGANQYLAGAQTIEAVVCSNLLAANIANGVTVKVGTATDDDSVASVTGTLTTPTIVQDPTTHGLHIS